MKTDNDQTFHTMNQREHIASLLGEAQRVILSPHDEADCAAWRIADAGLLLRQLLEADKERQPLIGVDQPTGRGAILPQKENYA